MFEPLVCLYLNKAIIGKKVKVLYKKYIRIFLKQNVLVKSSSTVCIMVLVQYGMVRYVIEMTVIAFWPHHSFTTGPNSILVVTPLSFWMANSVKLFGSDDFILISK